MELDAQGRTPCPDCGEMFKPRGMTAHRKQHIVKDAVAARTAEDIVRDVRAWGYSLLGNGPFPEFNDIPNSEDAHDIAVAFRKAVAVHVLRLSDR